MQSNILKTDINLAPSLQAAAVELEKNMATDSVKKELGDRASAEDLAKHNILKSMFFKML